MISPAVLIDTQTKRCERHGEYLARQYRDAQWSICPKCANEAFQKREAEEREQARLERLARALARSGIPARFHAAAFDRTIPQKLRDWSDSWAAGKSVGPAVLVGDVGTGKTHAACAALAHLIRAGAVGRFITVSEFGRLIRDQWTTHERTEASIIEEYARAQLLVLDDVGAQRPIDTELLQELICARYAADLMAATIITSNHSAKNFAALIGERAADRILEGAMGIPMTGRSRRKAPATGLRHEGPAK